MRFRIILTIFLVKEYLVILNRMNSDTSPNYFSRLIFLWLFGLAPSNPGLQELNNQLRYGQYHMPMGVDGLASLA